MFFSIGSDNKCFGDSCYTFAETGQTWSENRYTCQGKGGDLVSIETEEEWQFINAEIQKITICEPNEWHIGLKKTGSNWQWVNGKPLTINTKWQPTQPSGDGDFTVMSKDRPSGLQGLFNDLANYHKRAYICELPKGKRMKANNQISKNTKNGIVLFNFLKEVDHFLLKLTNNFTPATS